MTKIRGKKINKLFAAAAIGSALCTSAHAGVTTLGRYGSWAISRTTPDQYSSNYMCAMASTKPSDGSNVVIGVNSADLMVHVGVGKDGWNIPQNAGATVSLQVDSGQVWEKPHNTDVTPEGGALLMTISQDSMFQFLEELRQGARLTIKFSGNEPPWSYGLDGMWNAVPTFASCVRSIMPSGGYTGGGETRPYGSPGYSTQPYNRGGYSTQPYDPSQPYGNDSNPPAPSPLAKRASTNAKVQG